MAWPVNDLNASPRGAKSKRMRRHAPTKRLKCPILRHSRLIMRLHRLRAPRGAVCLLSRSVARGLGRPVEATPRHARLSMPRAAPHAARSVASKSLSILSICRARLKVSRATRRRAARPVAVCLGMPRAAVLSPRHRTGHHCKIGANTILNAKSIPKSSACNRRANCVM